MNLFLHFLLSEAKNKSYQFLGETQSFLSALMGLYVNSWFYSCLLTASKVKAEVLIPFLTVVKG